MKKLVVVGLLAGLSVVGTAAFADTPPASPPKEKKVCRREAVTGSIMSKSTCHTKTEWAQIDAANAENVRLMTDRAHPANGN